MSLLGACLYLMSFYKPNPARDTPSFSTYSCGMFITQAKKSDTDSRFQNVCKNGSLFSMTAKLQSFSRESRGLLVRYYPR